MTNKLLAIAFAALVAGCGSGSNNNNGGDDMSGAGGSGGGGGGGGSGPSDMAGVVPCVCPSGYSCDGNGVCVGCNSQAIGIDVKTVNVGGTITLNGAAPSTLPSCNPSPATAKATVHLVDTARGYQFELPVPCAASTFSWSGVVFPGSYKVTVTGDSNYSSLPTQAFVANADLEVAADAQNVALDVKTASVGGTVTLNGAAPTTAAACTSNPTAAKATVHLTDATDGYRFDLDVPCSSATFQWGGAVFPGTYVVSVDGDASYSNVPAASFIANSALAVAGSVANQALDIKTVHAAGTVTLDGAAPTSTCPTGSTYSKAAVHLTDKKQGYRFDFAVPCSQSDFSWTGAVYPGNYAVTVDGGSGYSNLPLQAYLANASLAVNADVSGQALDVQTLAVGGNITLDGAAPTPTQYCTSSPTSTQATVRLADADKGYSFSFTVPCSSTTLAWSGTIFPGNYRVTVAGQPSYSTLPDSAFVAEDGLAVTSAMSNLALDVKTANVAGTITLDSAAPTSDPACTGNPTQSKAVVRLTNAKLGYAFDLTVPCSSSTFAWTGQVFPGTYAVTVAGSNYSNLPDQAFLANSALTVSSDLTGQALDVKTASVGGTLTLNGAAPSTTTACNPNPTATKANVSFVDATSGYAFAVPVACSSSSFAWSGVVYPGTYRISVAGAGGYSNLPSEGFLVTPRLKVQ
ncbi:MAG TPA: hypothetical protein VHB97_13955 [Polyangia bacterium]|nr:hypothetical protein [Polyangia bacterium]